MQGERYWIELLGAEGWARLKAMERIKPDEFMALAEAASHLPTEEVRRMLPGIEDAIHAAQMELASPGYLARRQSVKTNSNREPKDG